MRVAKKREKISSGITKGARIVEGLLSQLQLGHRCSFLPQPWGLILPPFLLLAQESGEQCGAKRNRTVLPGEGKKIFPGSTCTGCTPLLSRGCVTTRLSYACHSPAA